MAIKVKVQKGEFLKSINGMNAEIKRETARIRKMPVRKFMVLAMAVSRVAEDFAGVSITKE